jgi:hypothetical protein
VFSVQICFTRFGLGETLEQFPAIACTNSLPFLLDLIYCCYFTSFSVANTLLDRSKYQIYISDFYAKNFCVKTEIFCNIFGVFCSISSKLLLAVFCRLHDRSKGICCPKTPRRLPQQTTLWLGNTFSTFLFQFPSFSFIFFILLGP